MMTVAEKSTTLFVPAEAMGLVIGKKGATFSSLRATEGLSHCRLVTDRLNGSTLELQGTPLAVEFVEQVIAKASLRLHKKSRAIQLQSRQGRQHVHPS